MTVRDLGKILCLSTVASCALLHAATFLMVVPGLLILVPFFLLMGAILCARVTQGWSLSVYRRSRPFFPRGRTAIAGWFLLVYAVLLFIHFYRNSGGASGVGIIDGQYVYMSKDTVLRPISEEEYKMFPTEVARIMSAWMGMMATFCLSSFINEAKNRSAWDNADSTP
jgi:hypothetical protein